MAITKSRFLLGALLALTAGAITVWLLWTRDKATSDHSAKVPANEDERADNDRGRSVVELPRLVQGDLSQGALEKAVEPNLMSENPLEVPLFEEPREAFTNEAAMRMAITDLKQMLADGKLDGLAYQSLIKELEGLMVASKPNYGSMLTLIRSEFDESYLSTLGDPAESTALLSDIETSLGYVWGEGDPDASLDFINRASDSLLTGWLAAQMMNERDYHEMLEGKQIQVSQDVLWQSLLEVAKSDTLVSLDIIVANHLDEMSLKRWRDILFSDGNSGDAVIAGWFEANIDLLTEAPNFDEVELIRMLRRYDYGEGPFMLSSDVELVETAKASGDFREVADLVEELSLLYDNTIDASAVGRFPLEWSKQDLKAASDWLLENSDAFSDPDSMESMLGTMFRHRSTENPEATRELALAIEDEAFRARALSNTLTPLIERSGSEVNTDWVSDLPEGFPKQRTMAAYALGLSRNVGDQTLEAQLKFQFLKNEFDLDMIQSQVLESDLSDADKMSVVNLLETY